MKIEDVKNDENTLSCFDVILITLFKLIVRMLLINPDSGYICFVLHMDAQGFETY